jgi:SAM-dependent methyltransferase
LYDDPVLVGLYDSVNPWGEREDYYLELIKSARATLDLGCGTGRLLKRAANVTTHSTWPRGDPPVFVGVDRQSSMLAKAKPDDETTWEESEIVWQQNDMRTVDLGRRFDLITITGHAFNELLTDRDIRMMLSNVLRHLDPAGRFAFDVDCPGGPVEGATPSPLAIQVATSSGESVDVVRTPERSIEPDLIEFTTTYAFAGSATPVVSRSVLRFIDRDHLRALLEDVGFRIDRWFGDWDRVIPITPSDAVDVVVASRTSNHRSAFGAEDVEPIPPCAGTAVGESKQPAPHSENRSSVEASPAQAEDVEPIPPCAGTAVGESKQPAPHSENRSSVEASPAQAEDVEPIPPCAGTAVGESKQPAPHSENRSSVEAPGTYVGRHRPPPEYTPRLRLKPKAPRSGYVDGAWWPRSDDLTTGLPELLAVLSVRLGPIDRVLYNLNEWVKAPAKLAIGGRAVRLDGYRHQPVNTVKVVGHNYSRIVLLVVPPHTGPNQAHATMMAAAAPNNADTVGSLLMVGVRDEELPHLSQPPRKRTGDQKREPSDQPVQFDVGPARSSSGRAEDP